MSQFIDPTYLRYIYDGLKSNTLQKHNASSLPDGLTGMYEEMLPPESNVKERKKVLEFFGVWALMKKEVSVDLINLFIGGKEDDIYILFYRYTKHFNTLSNGKSDLYHPRFRTFLLQHIDGSVLLQLNQKIIDVCLSYIQNSEEEIGTYSLQYLSFHLYWQGANLNMKHSETSQLEALQKLETMAEVFLDKEIWRQQFKYLDDKKWTLNSVRDTLCTAVLLNHELYTVKAATSLIEVENGIRADFDSLLLLAKEGTADLLIEKLNFLVPENLNSEQSKDYSTAIIIRLLLIIFSNIKKDEYEKTLKPFMDFLYQKPDLLKLVCEILPDVLRFNLSFYLYQNNIHYKGLFSGFSLKLSGTQSYQSPLVLSIEKYRYFIIDLLDNEENILNVSLIDSFLYSAINAQDDQLEEMVWLKVKPHYELSSQTLISWAVDKIKKSKSDEALKYFLENQYCISFYHEFIEECLTIFGFDYIFQILFSFFQTTGKKMLLFGLAEVCLHQNKASLSDYIMEELEKLPFDEYNISERDILNSISIKRALLDNPGNAFSFIKESPAFSSDSVFQLFYNRHPEQLLSLFNESGLDLYELDKKSLKQISFILGQNGMIEEFLTHYTENIRITLGKGLQSYDQFVYDESVSSFVSGLPDKLFNSFLSCFRSVILSNAVLGVSRTKVIFQFQVEVELYTIMISQNQTHKAEVLKNSIHKIIQSVKQPSTMLDNLIIKFYLAGSSGDHKMITRYFKNKISETTQIHVNHDWHLSQVALEFFSQGECNVAMRMVRKIDYRKFDNDIRFAASKWEKLLTKYINYCIEKEEYGFSVELASKTGGFSAIHLFHRIALHLFKNGQKDDFNLLLYMKGEVEYYKHSESYNYYTQRSNISYYLKGMILFAEVSFLFGEKDQADQSYQLVLDELNAYANKKGTGWLAGLDKAGDNNSIMKAFALSVLDLTHKYFYEPILRHIARLTHYFDDEWVIYAQMLKIELIALGQMNDAEMIEKKLIRYAEKTGKNLDLIVSQVDDSKKQTVSKAPKILNYTSGYDNKRKKIFQIANRKNFQTDSKDELVNTLIQLSTFKLFVENQSDDPVVKEINDLIDLSRFTDVVHANK